MRVTHLINDTGLGGVNRMIEVLLARLGSEFRQTCLLAKPGMRLPPVLATDAIVVHFTLSWDKLAWLQALRLRNPSTPVILVEHSYTPAFEALHVPEKNRFRLMLCLVAKVVDLVVSVSGAQRDWLSNVVGVSSSKLLLIQPYTDLEPLRLLPPPIRQPGPLRLCGYGRFAPQKGFDTLIEAMRIVSPDIASLRLVGVGPGEAALRAQAAGLPHVTVEGPVPGPASVFRHVDAVAMPSRFEAFGIVAAEARAAARAIIVSDVDGLPAHALPIPELMVPPENPIALADAIAFLARQNVTELGLAARNSVFGVEAEMIERWSRLLMQTAGQSHAMLAA